MYSRQELYATAYGNIAESIYSVCYDWKIVTLRFLNLIDLPPQQCACQEVLLIIQCNGTAKPVRDRSLNDTGNSTIPGTKRVLPLIG